MLGRDEEEGRKQGGTLAVAHGHGRARQFRGQRQAVGCARFGRQLGAEGRDDRVGRKPDGVVTGRRSVRDDAHDAELAGVGGCAANRVYHLHGGRAFLRQPSGGEDGAQFGVADETRFAVVAVPLHALARRK